MTDRTLDAEAVDLNEVARGVVERDQAAPCAVVGAAVRVERPVTAELRQLLPSGSSQSWPTVWRFGWGAAGELWREPPHGAAESPPMAAAHHIFDLASLTKPVTSLLLARLQREGVVSRDEILGDVLPELADTTSARIPLDVLLAHRSGLEAHREFFVKEANATQPDKASVLREAANARRAECVGALPAEGFPVVYSDLGYILVGAALERRTGRDLDELVQTHVSQPLGLTLGSVRRLEASESMLHARIVPTESVPWRGGVLRGVVHDENAWVLADRGSAGHAGLFGDVWSIVRLGTSVLDALVGNSERWLRAVDVEPLVRVRPGGSHRSGFDGRSDDAPMSGALFGSRTFGHLGFTGTSLWMDPEAMLVGVLLTNRVHPTRDHIAIRVARPTAYDALHRAILKT